LNPLIGFKHARYEVSEKNGTVNITIINKTNSMKSIRIMTEPVTAVDGKDYEGVDFTTTVKANEKEKTFPITIYNDAEWEPDKDFKIYLRDEDGQPITGEDTECIVTILDDDRPGILGFEERQIYVSRKQENVTVKVTRIDGSSGLIHVTLKTVVP